MTSIHLITKIQAPIQTVFDTARNIDFHQNSLYKTHEKAIDGRTSGLIELGETVTFKGKHFGFYFTHKAKIIKMEKPYYFIDKMIQGRFKSYKHWHFFEEKNNFIRMIDYIEYETSFGIIGNLFDVFFLKKYLIKLISSRNQIIKNLLEQKTQT